MGRLRKIVWGMVLAGWCFAGGPAFAEKRVALIVGNSNYDKVARLPNPTNDAALVAETLKTAGFDDVTLRRDLKITDMRRALRDFIDKSRDADVAVIYYAGHGIEVDGTNYLVPVDAVLERDVDIHDEALSLERVLVSVEPARKLRLVILDACRDSPFTRSMKAAAAEKARLAEQEKVRLAAEKAKQAEQEKAAAAELARIAAEKAAEEKKQQLAAVAPSDKAEQPAVDLPRALQAELRRVGCSTDTVDGKWSAASQKALDLFNKHAGMKLEVKTASTDALDAVKGKTGRICPLVCDHGFKANGDHCVKINCRAGYRINDDNECEKVPEKKPVAKREEPGKRDTERKKSESAPAKPQATGQYICSSSGGCRPVQKGCRLEQSKGVNLTISVEVCN